MSAAAVLAAALFSACGDKAAVYRPTSSAASLPAATATGCIFPSTSAQTVPLPSAGGVSGTISMGAFASASATCLPVTLATGGDATLQPASIRRAQAATTLPPPLLQIQLTNTYNGFATWSTVQLQMPAGTPAGTYPATIVTSGQEIISQTTNITITVNQYGSATVSGGTLSTGIGSWASGTVILLTMYPVGTVLPTPSPTPTASASPSGSPSPSPSPSITPTPSPTPSTSPTPTVTSTPVSTPTPTPSATPTYTVSILPAGCQNGGSAGGEFTYTAGATGPLPVGATGYGYGWYIMVFYPSGWSITVPNEGSTNTGSQIIGSSNQAQVTYPAFGSTGLTGEAGYVIAELYLDYNGVFEPITVPPGIVTPVYSNASTIADGMVTCASLGMAERKRPGPAISRKP